MTTYLPLLKIVDEMVLFVEAGFETGDAEVVKVKGDAHGSVFREALPGSEVVFGAVDAAHHEESFLSAFRQHRLPCRRPEFQRSVEIKEVNFDGMYL